MALPKPVSMSATTGMPERSTMARGMSRCWVIDTTLTSGTPYIADSSKPEAQIAAEPASATSMADNGLWAAGGRGRAGFGGAGGGCGAVADDERGAVALGRPVEQRLPGLLLAVHQARRIGGAIAQQIGAAILRGVVDHPLALAGHAVEAGGG